FTLKATGELDTGRLFVAENYAKKPAQSLIVADSRRGRRPPRPVASPNRSPNAVNDPFLSSDEVNESFKASRSPAASAQAR
ncbi:TQXA domain protein, partial [Amycolatopsis sp. NPDC051106]